MDIGLSNTLGLVEKLHDLGKFKNKVKLLIKYFCPEVVYVICYTLDP